MEPLEAGNGEHYGDGSSNPSMLVSSPTPPEKNKSIGSLDLQSGSEGFQSEEGNKSVTPSAVSGDNQDPSLDPESSPSAGQDLNEGTQETVVVDTLPVLSDKNKIPDSPGTIRSSKSSISATSGYTDGYPVQSIPVSPPAPSEESKSLQSDSEDIQSDANVKDQNESYLDLTKTSVPDDNTSTGGQGTSMGLESSHSDASVKAHSEKLSASMLTRAHDDIINTDSQDTSMDPQSSPSGIYYWIFVVLVPLIACLVYVSQPENHRVETPVQMFLRNLEKVEKSFQSQPDQLWKRSRIMLQKHLNTTTHSEPSILMFAAALDAEKTMRCLSHSIAGAYASALGSAAVEIDGSGTNLMDSDKVKLDLDERLTSAFDEGKKAAIIHHFQDLPPPSTLLFYKYCDHENAAFKDVSLLITVLLPEEKLEPDLSLNDLEEMVYDFLVVKFSVSDTPGQYNALDADKLSGLWSRLSHVILPVRPEKTIEENGCKDE